MGVAVRDEINLIGCGCLSISRVQPDDVPLFCDADTPQKHLSEFVTKHTEQNEVDCRINNDHSFSNSIENLTWTSTLSDSARL